MEECVDEIVVMNIEIEKYELLGGEEIDLTKYRWDVIDV